jgi:7-cyano-7-deazaguanine synthase
MISKSPTPPIGLLASGGLDSSILLGTLLERGRNVQPFYIRSGLIWEEAELEAVRRLLHAMAHPRLGGLVVLSLPLPDLYGDHWSVTGRGVPDRTSPDEAVYLPGRNALLAIKAGLWCKLHGIGELALGVLGSNPFADASPDFFEGFESLLSHEPGPPLRVVRPLAGLSKRQVMLLGRDLPLELTFSCIAPVGGLHCGACNKCAEREAAFRRVGWEDPTVYAASPLPEDPDAVLAGG